MGHGKVKSGRCERLKHLGPASQFSERRGDNSYDNRTKSCHAGLISRQAETNKTQQTLAANARRVGFQATIAQGCDSGPILPPNLPPAENFQPAQTPPESFLKPWET